MTVQQDSPLSTVFLDTVAMNILVKAHFNNKLFFTISKEDGEKTSHLPH